MSGPSTRTIIGVAILLFGGVLLGVGVHHMVATGSCSSTGYNQYGPVKYCPKGTGWWFGFVFGGIFLTLIGAFSSGGSSVLLLIPAIFSAIGLGAVSIVLDAHPSSGSKIFGLIFGGAFTAVGVIPALFAAAKGISRLGSRQSSGVGTAAASAFGDGQGQPDAILGAYSAGPSGGAGLGGAGIGGAGLGGAGIGGAGLGGGATVRPSASPVGGVVRATPPAMPAAGVTHAAGDGPLEKIAKLAELRDKGALTDDEFNREKAKLLAEL
jgi:Short C-terminal domain